VEEDGKINGVKLNGYRPRSYGDLVAIAVLISMLVSVVAWGLKLEEELNTVRNELFQIRMQVGNGILPRSEERINVLFKEVDELHEDFDDHRKRDH